jgi:paraquat-inducible protein B
LTYVLEQPSDPIEIPTVPSALEQAQSVAREIIEELRSVKFGPMVHEASEALAGINTLVNSPALHSAIDALPTTVNSMNETVASMRKLSDDLRGQLAPLTKRLDSTLAGADTALTSVRDTAGAARLLIEPGSPLDHDLRTTLRDVAAAARAMAQLADYLEQNPTSLLYGKEPQPEAKP